MNTLDAICKSVLLRKRYPMAYYLDALIAARDCLFNLTLHHLQIVNTKRFNVDEFGVVDFEGSVADVVSVFGNSGREIGFNPGVNSRDALDGTYGDSSPVSGNTFVSRGTYEILTGRDKLNISGVSGAGTVLVSYIGDGRDADAATHIDVYAEPVIEAYILWQFAEMSRTSSMGEKERLESKYIKQVYILRSVKANWNIPQLRRIVQRTYTRRFSELEINNIA